MSESDNVTLEEVGPINSNGIIFEPDGTKPAGGGNTSSATVIPFNPSVEPFRFPQAHCSLKQVQRFLAGHDLSSFADYEDGKLDSFFEGITEDTIPEMTARAVNYMRCNYDWSKTIWFFNGTGGPVLTMPFRQIEYVNVVFLRMLPDQVWYRFVRPRKIDGSEFLAIAGVEPPPPAPETIPPASSAFPYPQTVMYTGIEDADLYVDTRRRSLIIPPRVLGVNVAAPFYNQAFFRQSPMNVEVHLAYGFKPTKYTDGSPLTEDVSHVAVPTSSAGAPIDASSGMPRALSNAVARLVYADILRRIWRSASGGLSSISVDGGSESYGGKAFGGDPDDEEKRAYTALDPYSIRML